MAKFAKIFDTPAGQLLLTLDGMGDEDAGTADGWVLTARGEARRGVGASTAFTFGTEEAAQAAFDCATQEQADNTAAEMRGAIDGLMGPEEEGGA